MKIRDKERLEPPHVTLMRKTREWRLGLRDGEFLEPPGGTWSDIPAEVARAVRQNWATLRREWNARYPENPVEEDDGD